MTFLIEQDIKGNGTWSVAREIRLAPNAYTWLELTETAFWLRLSSPGPLTGATAWFQFANRDPRASQPDRIFDGLAGPDGDRMVGGLVRSRGENKRTLSLAAMRPGRNGPTDVGYYELDADLKLRRVDDSAVHEFTKQHTQIPTAALTVDEASVVYTSDDGKRWRLPKGHAVFDHDGPLGPCRVDREVATERDLFNAHGTFYELPAENAGAFAKVRPVATHERLIHDHCSYRGLFVMTGIADNTATDNPHIIRSDDGKTAIWVGAIDDVWKLGKPRGTSGPWKNTAAKAGHPGDPYLMTGYDRKLVKLSQSSGTIVNITLEVELDGTGLWVPYKTFAVQPKETLTHEFPAAFNAYWVRTITDRDATVTVIFEYQRCRSRGPTPPHSASYRKASTTTSVLVSPQQTKTAAVI
ncbi:MAG: hypothetical protein QHJ82_09395 [Verrucomicrobiota bacterium]|nr:hypothetical protein [Verrucomicrobiota bacterium]